MEIRQENYNYGNHTKSMEVNPISDEEDFLELESLFKEMMEKPTEQETYIFGQEEIQELNQLKTELETLKNDSTASRDEIEEKIKNTEQDIKDKFRDMDGFLLRDFIKELSSKPSGEKITELSQGDIANFERLLEKEAVPVDLLEEMIKDHLSLFETHNQEFKEKIAPVLLAEFKNRVQKAINAGELSLTAEEFESRLDGIKFELQDYLTTNKSGYYNPRNHCVQISSELLEGLQNELERAISHELVHSISGRTYAKGKIVRLGLSFENGTPDGILKWLNEAKTEEINMDLLETKSSPSYYHERTALKQLYGQGVSSRQMDKAYFENYNSDDPAIGRAKHWREMIKSMKDIFPEGGIKKLRSMEKKFGTTNYF